MQRKSPTQLGAQIGLYLSQMLPEDDVQKDDLFRHLDLLTTLDSLDDKGLKDNQWLSLKNNLRDSVINYRRGYIDFLRTCSRDSDFIQSQNEARNYDEFISNNPQIRNLIATVKKVQFKHNMGEDIRFLTTPFVDELRTLPNYLNSGSEGDVFDVPSEIGDMVMKICAVDPFQIHEQVAGFKRATKVSDLTPKLHYFSFSDRVLVISKKKGERLTPELIGSIPDDRLLSLLENMYYLHKEEVSVDIFPDNLIYDAEEGFSILDVTIDNHVTQALFIQELASFVSRCVMFKETKLEVEEERGEKGHAHFLRLIQLLKKLNPALFSEILEESNSSNKSFFLKIILFLSLGSTAHLEDFKKDLMVLGFKFDSDL